MTTTETTKKKKKNKTKTIDNNNEDWLTESIILKVAYFILFLDFVFFVSWLAISIYILSECRLDFTTHFLIVLHFAQTVAILSVIDEYYKDIRQARHHGYDPDHPYMKKHRAIKNYSPLFWIGASIISLTGDSLLLTLEILQDHICSHVGKIDIALDSFGIVICIISIVWFIILTVYANRQNNKKQSMYLFNELTK